jgi:ATP-dependent helicase HepA
VRFREGDTITTHDDQTLIVEKVQEKDGLITYFGHGRELPEALLSDTISFHSAQDRLLAGQVDDNADFQLRQRTLKFQHQRRKSNVRGFLGGRIDLIPHQLYIAHEVSSRQAPRVMLSDEVGLGKTIEACLILHRLLLSGRATRVLILVPESLVHQWFIEMLRRFNVWLNIFDEERCQAIDTGDHQTNPFLDDQLVICSIQLLAQSSLRADQALSAGWDILVVDEAHHLEWSLANVSSEYTLVESLSRQVEGLLLLTRIVTATSRPSRANRANTKPPRMSRNV